MRGVEEGAVVLEVDEQPQSVPLGDVEQAHLVYEWQDE